MKKLYIKIKNIFKSYSIHFEKSRKYNIIKTTTFFGCPSLKNINRIKTNKINK